MNDKATGVASPAPEWPVKTSIRYEAVWRSPTRQTRKTFSTRDKLLDWLRTRSSKQPVQLIRQVTITHYNITEEIMEESRDEDQF